MQILTCIKMVKKWVFIGELCVLVVTDIPDLMVLYRFSPHSLRLGGSSLMLGTELLPALREVQRNRSELLEYEKTVSLHLGFLEVVIKLPRVSVQQGTCTAAAGGWPEVS